MGRLLTITAMLVVASVSSGCHSCMQSGYYDPCGGVVYGPSVKKPTFLSGLKKHKHEEHSCPLCNSDAPSTPRGVPAVNGGVDACCQHGQGSTWSSTPTYPAPASYGAAFDKTVQQDARTESDLKPVEVRASHTATAQRQSLTATSATPAPIPARFRTVIPVQQLATATQESSTTGHSTRERTRPIQ
jgi:hypothetical protein